MTPRSNDRSYHELRALEELRRAEEATDPDVASVHRELAALHRRRMMEIALLGEPQRSAGPLIGARRPRADSK